MRSHQIFVDYFVHEFMEELWYLQKVTRGDIAARQEANSWEIFFNVTQALLSVAPIPGLPLGFLLSKKLLEQCKHYGSIALKTAKSAQSGYQKGKEFLAGIDQAQGVYESLMGKPDSKGMLQQEGPMDLTAIRVVVELVGRGLAERYEHLLTAYLVTDAPDKSLAPLARIAARRLFSYLQSQPLLDDALSGDLLAQRSRLLNGVVLGNIDKSWRERLTGAVGGVMPRVLKDLQKVTLPPQDAPKQQLGLLEKFTAEGALKYSAWYDEKQVYDHSKTKWQTPKGKPQQPKYGYAYLASRHIMPTADMKPVSVPVSNPPRATRYYRPVDLAEIQAYLASPEIITARRAKKTATFTFHDFLRQQGHPQELQAVCHADLAAIKDWSFANFSEVDFSGVTLTGNLSGVSFVGSYLVGSTAKAVACTREHPVILSRAQIGFSDWREAKLPKADLTQTNCSLTNFSGAEFTDIVSEGATWYKTDLSGVNRQDLIAEQAKQVNAAQKAFRERMRALDGRITQLEQTLMPLLTQLAALEKNRHQAAEDKAKEGAENEKATEKIAQLEQSIAELHTQIAQTANHEFVAQCKAEFHELHQRTDDLRIDIDQLKSQLQQLESCFARQISVSLTQVGDVGRKLLAQQTAVQLSHRVKELVYYLPPTVIAALPEEMTWETLMEQLNQVAAAKGSAPAEDKMPKEAKEVEVEEEKKLKEGKTHDPVPAPARSSFLPERFDILTVIDQFLTQEKSLLLLLGEPGAGKSLTTWQAIRRLVEQFQPDMSGESISRCWLPISIELNAFSVEDLNGLLDRQLANYDLSAAAIAKLKQATPGHSAEPKVVLFLDGYDELRGDSPDSRRDHTDLFKRLGGEQWKKGQLKIIVTCRRRYLANDLEERMIFGVGQNPLYERFELLPFNWQQISRYVEMRSASDVGGGLLKPEVYLQTLEASPHLKILVSNPFVLQLFLESLPRLRQARQEVQQLVRLDLYTAFMDQWIEREVRRLTPAKKAELGRADDVTLVKDFKRLAMYLALSLYAHQSLTVTFQASDQVNYQVWDAVLEKFAEEARAEYEKLAQRDAKSLGAARFGAAKSKLPTQEVFLQQALNRANQLVDILPLTRSGDVYRFMHKSFYEYLVAAALVALSDPEEPEAVKTTILAFLKQRLIQTEPAILQFLQEWMQSTENPRAQKRQTQFQTALVEIVKRSAQQKDLGQASSNAATVLNHCRVRLMNQAWQGVQLPGADLSYSILAYSDLRQANLRGAILMHAMLCQTNLTSADLREVQWGEQAWLELRAGASPVWLAIKAIAQHPTQPWLAIARRIGMRDYDIVLMNTETGERIGQAFAKHAEDIDSVAFSPDGRYLASGGGRYISSFDSKSNSDQGDYTIRLWDVDKQCALGEGLIGHRSCVKSVAFSPDGRCLASGSWDHTVRLWDVAQQKLLVVLEGHNSNVESVAFSPDGRCLASGGDNVRLWNVVKQVPLGVLLGHEGTIHCLAFSPDGRYLASGNSFGGDNNVRLWDVAKQVTLGVPLRGHEGYVYNVAFSPDGRLLASGSWDHTVRLWDVATQAPLGAPLTGHSKPVCSIAFSPDGRCLASGSYDGTVRLWDIAKQIVLNAPSAGHTQRVSNIAFSLDGRFLASGSKDHTVQLWDAVKQTPLRTLLGHKSYVYSIAFSPDGRYLASGGWSHGRFLFLDEQEEEDTIRLWDIAKQAPLGVSLVGYTGTVSSVAFSPDGRYLASGGWLQGRKYSEGRWDHDYSIRLWDVARQAPLGIPLAGAYVVCK